METEDGGDLMQHSNVNTASPNTPLGTLPSPESLIDVDAFHAAHPDCLLNDKFFDANPGLVRESRDAELKNSARKHRPATRAQSQQLGMTSLEAKVDLQSDDFEYSVYSRSTCRVTVRIRCRHRD